MNGSVTFKIEVDSKCYLGNPSGFEISRSRDEMVAPERFLRTAFSSRDNRDMERNCCIRVIFPYHDHNHFLDPCAVISTENINVMPEPYHSQAVPFQSEEIRTLTAKGSRDPRMLTAKRGCDPYLHSTSPHWQQKFFPATSNLFFLLFSTRNQKICIKKTPRRMSP